METVTHLKLNTELIILGEITLAGFLGGLIGLERELANKPAGFRTHIIVASVGALLISLGNFVVLEFDFPDFVNADPIRAIEAIIVGISFLGAGTIIQREEKNKVEGLTTSASVLAAAAIGIAVGIEMFLLAFGSTLFIVFTNRALNWFEQWLSERLNNHATSEEV